MESIMSQGSSNSRYESFKTSASTNSSQGCIDNSINSQYFRN